MDHLASIALALALAWASGIRLYAVLFLVGLAGNFHWFNWSTPNSFALLSHPLVLGTTGFMLFIEFFADKIPAVDSIWDAIHTFIRIPAGALLAAGVIGAGDGPAWALAAGLLGGTITAGTHFMKAGGRAAINTSPEPVSNWLASFTEDVIVLGGGLSNIDRLYTNVPAQWGAWVFSDRVDTRLVRHMHGDSSGVRGAAWLWNR